MHKLTYLPYRLLHIVVFDVVVDGVGTHVEVVEKCVGLLKGGKGCIGGRGT